MIHHLSVLGFTEMDFFLVFSCILSAVVGSMVDYLFRRESFSSISEKRNVNLTWERYAPLIVGRSFIGAVAGIVVYLLLVGTITLDVGGYARLMILSGMAGFSAPVLAQKYRSNIPKQLSELGNE